MPLQLWHICCKKCTRQHIIKQFFKNTSCMRSYKRLQKKPWKLVREIQSFQFRASFQTCWQLLCATSRTSCWPLTEPGKKMRKNIINNTEFWWSNQSPWTITKTICKWKCISDQQQTAQLAKFLIPIQKNFDNQLTDHCGRNKCKQHTNSRDDQV